MKYYHCNNCGVFDETRTGKFTCDKCIIKQLKKENEQLREIISNMQNQIKGIIHSIRNKKDLDEASDKN